MNLKKVMPSEKKSLIQKGTDHMMYLKYTVWWEIKEIKQV